MNLLKLLGVGGVERIDAAEMVRQDPGHGGADVLDAEREQEPVEPRALAVLDRGHQVLDRFLGEARQRGDVDGGEVVEVRDVPHQALFDQLSHRLAAEADDVHGAARNEVVDVPFELGRARQPVRAHVIRADALDLGAARRAL